MSRKVVNMQPNNSQIMNKSMPKKPVSGFFGEEEESEATRSMFFSQSMFRAPENEMLTSQSPSQLSSFGSNLYAPPSVSALQQQRTVTPTSMSMAATSMSMAVATSIAPNFPLGLQQQQQQQQQPPPPQQQQQSSPNSRNLFSLSSNQRGILNAIASQSALSNQLKRPNTASSALPSSTSNTVTNLQTAFGRKDLASFLPILPDVDGTQSTSLDPSEFPILGNRIAPPNPLPTARNYVGMVSKPAQETTPEFQIQQEDFPALPGAQNPPPSISTDILPGAAGSILGHSYDQALKDTGKFMLEHKSGSTQKRGIQTSPDGTVSNIPLGMVTDQFGMVGLLTFIRAAETDSNLVPLAPGIDLTTLGLNLNSPDNLYNTFQSPWSDNPCRPQDIDFHVPTEYLTNIFIREKLAPFKLNRYGEDLLFFLFFMNGGDVLQLAAAAELYNRNWRYHKDEKVWITRAHGMDPVVETSTYERGTYYYFDVNNWRKVLKEFYLEYDKLEERPQLPATLHQNPYQPPAAATVAAH